MNAIKTRLYEEALFRASYFRWLVAKGDVLLGGDPVTGLPHSTYNALDRAEARASNLARARFWLAEARRRRLAK